MSVLHVISRSSEAFRSREEAGALLGRELQHWRGKRPVVLGIPRGGMVVARRLAREIDGDLDMVLSRKLGAPGNPEFAIGAVAEDGRVFMGEESFWGLDEDSPYVKHEIAAQLAEIKRRIERYRVVLPKLSLKDRVVIVTDDGVATGATMRAALWAARQEHPQTLIGALPVGPEESLERLAHDVDELLCLRVPPFFSAVGQFYDQFAQTSEEELMEILAEEAARRAKKKNGQE